MGLGNNAFRSNVQLVGGWLWRFLNLNDDDDTPSAGIWHDGSFVGPVRDDGGQVFNVKSPRFGDGGAKGNGTTDDTDAIQDAIDACEAAGGGIVFFPLGTYRVTAVLTVTAGVRLVGAGHGSVLDSSDVASGNYLITIEGSLPGTTTTASVAITKAATTITVASNAGFAAGDLIKITSTQAFSETDSTYKKGELAVVKSVSGSTSIVLSQGTKDSYAVSGQTVTLARISALQSPGMERIKVVGGGAGSAHLGIFVRYAIRPRMVDVLVVDSEDVGIGFDHVMEGVMDRCCVINTDGGGAVPGYAMTFDTLCQDCSLVTSSATNFRHAFEIGSLYPCWNWSVSNCHFSKNVGDFEAISTHQNAKNGTITGGTIHDSYTGIGLTGPGTTVSGVRFTAIRYSCVDLTADAPLKTAIVGCVGEGVVRGVTTGAYTGSTKPDVSVVGCGFFGEAIGGVSVGQGISCNTKNAKLLGNKLRGFSPGIGVGADAVVAEGNDVNDVVAGQPYGFLVHTSAAGVRIRGNKVYDESAGGVMTHAVNVDAASDLTVEDNEFSGYATAPVSDSGTRTRFRNNTLASYIRQRASILGTTVGGVTNGTTAGKAKTVNTIAYEINGRRLTKAATDDLWTMSGATTAAGQFRKVLLCLNESGTASVINGTVAASQTVAKIPDWHAFNVCPVAFVEIPESYTDGGSLAGYIFQDLVGGVG